MRRSRSEINLTCFQQSIRPMIEIYHVDASSFRLSLEVFIFIYGVGVRSKFNI